MQNGSDLEHVLMVERGRIGKEGTLTDAWNNDHERDINLQTTCSLFWLWTTKGMIFSK